MTIDLILSSQKNDSQATLVLIEKFNPLLKKYAFKLFYEDAYNDLLVDFMELIQNIRLEFLHHKDEGGVVSYIVASIHNSYVKRVREIQKRPKLIVYSDLNDSELYYIEVSYSTSDTYRACDISSIEKLLTKTEMSVIEMVYLFGYSPTEIAKIFGVSRQAINQMKNRALKKLSGSYTDKPCGREAG